MIIPHELWIVYLVFLPIVFVVTVLLYKEAVGVNLENNINNSSTKYKCLALVTALWPFVLLFVVAIGSYFSIRNSCTRRIRV